VSLKEHKTTRQDENLALSVAFAEIDKKFGKGSVMILGERSSEELEVISSGSLFLNEALGVGGYPRGRVIEIFGAESSGKTTLALHAIAQAQKAGGVCAFIDAEHSLDPIYASKLGVNSEALVVAQPDYGEQALEITEVLIRSGAIDLLVVDSVAALVPKAEIEGDMGDSHMGLQARLMSQALRKMTPIINKSKTVLIFINQVRQKINAMPFANKETTTGGTALKFYASVRLEVKRIGTLKRNDVPSGNKVLVKVVKNKVSPPFRFAELEINFDSGISKEKELLDAGLAKGLFRQAGAFYYYKNEKYSQGREACLEKLKADVGATEEILALVKKEGVLVKEIGRDSSSDDE
jgi:recombination protein RecA